MATTLGKRLNSSSTMNTVRWETGTAICSEVDGTTCTLVTRRSQVDETTCTLAHA